MPLARYFLFVGGVLLALLFVSSAVMPKLPAAEPTITSASTDLPTVRIRSDRKWPERVVFDTNLPTIVPTPAAKPEIETTAAVAAPVVAEYSAKARVRESFAQFKPSDDPKQPVPKAQPKRKMAKAKVFPPMGMVAQQSSPMRLVAQQPQFGFFGNNTW